MANIVTIEDKKYMLDIGFGANGPTQPMLLEHGYEVDGIEPSRIRLIYDHIPDTTNKAPDQRLWIFQCMSAPTERWKNLYSFTELEFLPQDYEIMNYWTSHSRKTFFTFKVVAVKYLLDDSGELVGTMTMVGGEVKRVIEGKSEVLMECKTEDERVQALKEVFGIGLIDEERRGIKGLVTELK